MTRRPAQTCALLCLAAAAGCSGVPWQYDFQGGLRDAAESRKRLLLMFCTAVSPSCREMDAEALSDPSNRQLLGGFIPVRVDATMNRELATQYNVEVVPTFVIFRPDGSVAGTGVGGMDPETFRGFLIRNRFN